MAQAYRGVALVSGLRLLSVRLTKASPLAREAVLSAAVAATAASLLVWLGPPGADLAAHVVPAHALPPARLHALEQLLVRGPLQLRHLQHALLPARGAARDPAAGVASVATAALAFTVVVARQWGPAARWSSRTFAVVWAGIVLSAAFPFALGVAFALLALWTLQAGATGTSRC